MNKLEFIEDIHQYLYNGVIIPSVSEIIAYKFPDMYKGIPEKVLSKKAEYGTKTHDIIENVLMNRITLDEVVRMDIDPNIKISAQIAKDLCREWIIQPEAVEQQVCYKGRYAGTYDMITYDNIIIDIKTTSKLYIDNETLQAPLNLQISLYYMAAGIENDYGYVLWIPKGSFEGFVKKVNCWKWDDLKGLLEEYEKSKKQSNGHISEDQENRMGA